MCNRGIRISIVRDSVQWESFQDNDNNNDDDDNYNNASNDNDNKGTTTRAAIASQVDDAAGSESLIENFDLERP